VACNVLEVVMRQYYATTLLSTQNKMFTDVTKANALLGSPEYQVSIWIPRCIRTKLC
jgi:hypothetical protein